VRISPLIAADTLASSIETIRRVSVLAMRAKLTERFEPSAP